MVRHRIFIALTALKVAVLMGILLYCWGHLKALEDDAIPAKRVLSRQLGLTDLSIWTEARYTRHPSQADFFAPFQDFPSSLEHFPSGSVVAPTRFDPATLTDSR